MIFATVNHRLVVFEWQTAKRCKSIICRMFLFE
jgi:hypothetical protein